MAAVDSAVNLGVLISGFGSNLQAIIDAVERGEVAAQIKVVISNRADAFGLERARRHGIEAVVIEHRRFPTREAFDHEVVDVLKARQVELVILAGFMRLLSSVMIQAFPNRIMNIHPALLPAFPGLNVQKAAIDRGARFSGCTVFFVSEGLDDGPIIIQAVVPVYPEDTEQELSERILTQEHQIYPRAIQLYQQGKLEVRDGKVLIKGEADKPSDQVMFNPPLR
ncbi:MAG TPA: phosphoribosylglycinamide formyltransferase [Candidatus Binataceae bacterium]|nr:phosphoribosylglycinamide formyltransferase [Candidatus Binataceae bacterium]